MNKNARIELLKRVNEEGSKAYKGLVLTESDKSFFLDELSSRKLSRKEVNFFKYVDSYQVEKSKDSKKAEKVDTKDGEQMLLNIIDSKETVKEETKPVETKEDIKEEKVANKKKLSSKEKIALAKAKYKEEFIKALGDQKDRKILNNFLRTEITDADEIENYCTLSDFNINAYGLKLLYNKAVFILSTEEYGLERVVAIDFDYHNDRPFVLVKSLETKNYDRIFFDEYDNKKGVFTHVANAKETYDIKFHIPVLKKGVKLD